MKIAFWCLILLLVPTISYALPNDKQAILAIIGEAENQGYDGMLAVAEVIRNRGSLRQVFGATSERVIKRLYSQKTYNIAKQAWKDSQYSNSVGQSIVWGNKSDVQKFKRTKWFKKMILVKQVKDHYFYRKA